MRRAVSAWLLFAGSFTCLVGAQAATMEDGATAMASPFIAVTGADGVQRATITLDSYSYDPSHLVVQSGHPVELTLVSVTILTPHNFVLKEGGLSIEQDVSAGKTVKVRFTPPQPGVFPFYCDKQLLFFKSHREKGMEGRLEVRP